MTRTRLLAALVIAAAGCGGSGATGGSGGAGGTTGATGGNGGIGAGGSPADGGSGGGGPIPISQYEPLVLAAGCHNLVLCGSFPDVATCLSSDQVVSHLYDTLAADVVDGKVSYDAVQARACVDEWNSLPCTRTMSLKHPNDPCDSVFAGTVAVGGACFFDPECAAGGSCQIDYTNCGLSQCCPGSCVEIPPPAGAGGDCTSAGATCVTGTTCTPDASGLTATCQPTPGVGQACAASTVACVYPLYCDPTSGTCKAPVDTGEACNPQLKGQDCNEEADLCDPTTSVCTRFPGPGRPCDPTFGLCLYDAWCDTTTDTCLARPAVGQPCDDRVPCLGDDRCDPTSSTCVLLPTAGACP